MRLGCTTYTAREVARDLRDHRAAPGSLSLQTETPELAPHRAQTASDVTIGFGQPEHANKTTPQWQFLYCQTMPCPAMVDATETLRREKGEVPFLYFRLPARATKHYPLCTVRAIVMQPGTLILE